MVAIFAVSATSNPPMPSGVSDRSLHGAAYLGLGLLLIRAFAGARWSGVTPRALSLALVAAIVYGATDEWHQSFVPNRHADLGDLGADAIGALAAVVGVWACGIIRRL